MDSFWDHATMRSPHLRTLRRYDPLSLELAGQVAKHFGKQGNWELNLPVVGRWHRFPRNDGSLDPKATTTPWPSVSGIPSKGIHCGGGQRHAALVIGRRKRTPFGGQE